jgi:cell division protein FtsW (lipid II flippase)
MGENVSHIEKKRPAKRAIELKYLFLVFAALGLGFFLVHQHFMRRTFPFVLTTISGEMEFASYLLNPFPNALYFVVFACLFLLAHFHLRSSVPEADPYILPAIAFISGVGSLMMLRLAPDLALMRNDALWSIVNANPSVKITDNVRTLAQLGTSHFTNLVVGVLAFLITISVFSRRFFAWMSGRRYVWIALSSLLFLATWFFGTTINGKKLWFMGFQTIELVKILVLFFIAAYLYNEGKGISAHGKSRFFKWCQYTVPYAAACILLAGPTLLQKDFGAAMLLFVVCFIMLHLAGNKFMITAFVISLIALTGWTCYAMDSPHVLRERIDMFLDPFGRGEALATVLWSISTGGIFGNGIGFGLAHRIPEVQSDFNFAAICEEMGLLGGMSILLAYTVLLQRLFKASRLNSNLYKKMLIIGIALTIAAQSFIIVAGNLNGIPLTGVTLPFCSYGGSSLIASFIMAGIAIRITGEDR